MRAGDRSTAAQVGGLLVLCVSLAALLLTLSVVPSARAEVCPNEAIRSEQGAAALALPECRAYELVSPGSIASLSQTSVVENGGGKASPDGEALSYFSRYPATGSNTSSETWLSNRTAAGWTVTAVDPQMTPNPSKASCSPGVSLSETLGAFIFSAGGELQSSEENRTGECGVPMEELVPGEPRGFANLYLRREGGSYELVNPAPLGISPANATFQAASADLSHVVFHEEAELTSNSAPGSDLFEWSEGTVRAIGILPNGEAVPATVGAGSKNWGEFHGLPLSEYGLAPVSHAMSADGERVFFEANGGLYLRENAGQAPAAEANCLTTSEPELGCTVQIDRSFGESAPGPGGGVFQFASRDGSRVFFTSDHALTGSATAQPGKPQTGKPDLYEYNLNQSGPKVLTDLTAVGQSESANVRGFSGGSDDGSRIYFVARGVLTGSEQNGAGETALAGQPNIYLAHEGDLTYVATLSPWETSTVSGGKDSRNWWEAVSMGGSGELATYWSPSGNYLLFSSVKPLTGFANSPAETGLCESENCKELFLYNAETDGLSCVSCDPAGDRPVSNTSLFQRIEFQRVGPPGPRYLPRAVLDSGQVFFETTNALLPNDVNGFQDVYEYNAGTISLISSGSAMGGSGFLDAGADGRDVFFITSEPLVRSDGDGLPSVYDARVDGGFTEPPLPPEPCGGEGGCRAPAGPPPPGDSSSTSTVGSSGNVKPKPTICKRGFVRKGGRCVKKPSRNQNPKKYNKPRKHDKKNAKKKQHGHGGKH